MEEKEVKTEENLTQTAEHSTGQEPEMATAQEAETDKLSKLERELEEQKDKYLRLYADFDNIRRRSAKERLEYTQTAGKEVIIGLLEVLDDMERAEKMINGAESIEAIREGLELVFHKFSTYLKGKGLKEMERIGHEFDVELHEAITEIPGPGSEGKVIDQVEKGYLLNDKIIRFAKVVVGKQA